jgi:hypothetical protein
MVIILDAAYGREMASCISGVWDSIWDFHLLKLSSPAKSAEE